MESHQKLTTAQGPEEPVKDPTRKQDRTRTGGTRQKSQPRPKTAQGLEEPVKLPPEKEVPPGTGGTSPYVQQTSVGNSARNMGKRELHAGTGGTSRRPTRKPNFACRCSSYMLVLRRLELHPGRPPRTGRSSPHQKRKPNFACRCKSYMFVFFRMQFVKYFGENYFIVCT